ncbi:hypothetical protein AVEN_107321-1 [Araneus ventricosus]|uniref:Uncharacterized protein n=1 Tax=Araneus ventricosus TaxID=182803 RepID=A0A4Y2JVL9_ARAVE|nr:hypothetical protein AVEN_107321-1 [Araneus ventricosus]
MEGLTNSLNIRLLHIKEQDLYSGNSSTYYRSINRCTDNLNDTPHNGDGGVDELSGTDIKTLAERQKQGLILDGRY